MDDLHRSKDAISIELLDRYLTGEATTDERARVAAWVADDASRASLGTLPMRDEVRDPVVEAAWIRIARKMEGRQDTLTRIVGRTVSSPVTVHVSRETMRHYGVRVGLRTLRAWLWSAGAVAMILLAYVLVRPASSHTTDTTISYATDARREATITLNDGTRVTLAPRTTLRLVHFGTHTRTVDLDGEAYIEVARAAGTPFVVRSNGVTVQVLGTAFLMRHYRDEPHVHVAVANGKVRVHPHFLSDRAVTLVAGHVADVSDSTIKTLAIDASASDADWVGGKLSFHNKPLPEILATLSRWYGYEFRVSDSTLARARITLVLSTRSSTTVLALLEQLLNVNLVVVGDTVTLAPQAPQTPRGMSHLHNYDVWTPTREVGR